ncbi:MAG: DUF429 domain-containing protein [Nocardioides sp.]
MTGRVWGVDGCRAGWVAVLADDGPLEVRVAPTLAELVASGEPPDVLAVDVPIGLPDHGRRVADVLARRALPGKAPSVFPTLVRAAYAAPTYAAARAAQLAATGHSASAQADALRARVLDADAFVRAGPTFAVLEAHPELAFARLAGAPALESKRTPAGVALRRRLLAEAGLVAPAHQPGHGYAEDDLLDACVLTLTAARHRRGEARSLPDPPEVFADGVPAAIWV